MDMYNLLSAIKTAIADDADVKAWTQDVYKKDHMVFLGTDRRQEPDEDKYPLVGIFPVSKECGYDATIYAHEIDVVCGVHDDDMVDTGVSNLIEYAGIERIEIFRKKVENAIASTNIEGIITMLRIAYEAIEFFPFFLAGMTIRISEYVSLGDDAFK